MGSILFFTPSNTQPRFQGHNEKISGYHFLATVRPRML
jgi:hypothetical protein